MDGLSVVMQHEGYYVYENSYFRPRANVDILSYSPNSIVVDTSELGAGESVLLSEIYSSGWKASDSENNDLVVEETPGHMRSITLTQDTDQIKLAYVPPGYETGTRITAVTLLIIGVYSLMNLLAAGRR